MQPLLLLPQKQKAKTSMIIKLRLTFIFSLLCIFAPTAHPMTPQEKQDLVKHERCQTRIIDIMVLTLIAQAMGEHAIAAQNLEWGQTKILISAALGISSWAAGELCESMYKTVYEKIKGKKLRRAMGQTTLGNITIDHQRTLRRVISMIVLLTELYILSNNPTLFSQE